MSKRSQKKSRRKSPPKPTQKKYPRGRHPNSYANLKLWPKGVSGNPLGRPKLKPLTDLLKEYLENPQNAAALVESLLKEAIKTGNYLHFKEICDRIEGKVAQRVELAGGEGLPIQVADARAKLFEKLGS